MSADPLHCQKKTARIAVDKGGDYFFQIKGNQPTLLEYARIRSEGSEILISTAVRRRSSARRIRIGSYRVVQSGNPQGAISPALSVCDKCKINDRFPLI